MSASGDVGSAAPPARVCAVCGAEAVSQCVNCKVTAYCSRRCQKRHWSRGGHKYRCFSPEERAKRAAFDTPANREKLWDVAVCGDEAVAQYLIAHGADVDYRDPVNGVTPLFIAAERGHDAIVRALLDAGADKDLAAHDGATPLFIAADNGHDAVVRALLDAGAGKDLADNGGVTPLFIAAQEGYDAVVRTLLDAGADRNKAANDGKTPLSVATERGRTAIADLLRSHGATAL